MSSPLTSVQSDPIIAAIAHYRGGIAAYNAFVQEDTESEECDAFAEISYVPPMKVLDEWDRPAVSLVGVREAVRLALDESKTYSSSYMIPPLLAAALAHLEVITK